MIIILSSKGEAHSEHVANFLKNKKEDYIFFDTREYPNKVFINWIASENNLGTITIEDKTILLSDIKSVYWRNFFDIRPEKFEDGENTEFLSKMLERERRSALYSLFYGLDINWVNSMNAFDLHKKKAFLTNQYSKAGIRVPRTLITNQADAVIDFYEKNNKNIIYKPVLGGAFTKKVTEEDFQAERLETLKISPVQFQECIEGVDIRVYAYKERFYAARIEAKSLDFRADSNVKLIRIELPSNIKEDCIKMMKIADLKYSGIDIRLTPEGEYVFIEANPAPMFIHAENVTGYPLTEELYNLLVE